MVGQGVVVVDMGVGVDLEVSLWLALDVTVAVEQEEDLRDDLVLIETETEVCGLMLVVWLFTEACDFVGVL